MRVKLNGCFLNSQKCTYGNKCKFQHPERGPHPHKSVTERLVEHAQRHLQARGPSLSLPLSSTNTSVSPHPPLCKTRSAVPLSVVQPLSSIPKSRSVENVTSDLSATSPALYSQQMPPVQNLQGDNYEKQILGTILFMNYLIKGTHYSLLVHNNLFLFLFLLIVKWSNNLKILFLSKVTYPQ